MEQENEPKAIVKEEGKNAMRKMYFVKPQKLLTNIKVSSGQRKQLDVSLKLIAVLQTYLSHRLSTSSCMSVQDVLMQMILPSIVSK